MNNISEFRLAYDVVNSTNTSGSNFSYGGDVIIDDAATAVTFQPIPFEFSPSSGLLLSGGSWLAIKSLKKQQVAKLKRN